MAAEIGPADAPLRDGRPGLDDTLFREGFRFEFFQAVRLLERLYPDRKPVGRYEHPKDEVVRFRTHVSMAFPASEVYDVIATPEPAAETDPATTMWVTFMGLAGSLGVMPRQYTQLLADPSAQASDGGHPRLPRHLQSPPDLPLLPRVGEVPVSDRVRAA